MTAYATSLPADFADPEGLLQTLLNVALTGFQLWRPIYSPDGVALMDFFLEYMNPAGQQMLGFPVGAAITLRTRFPHSEVTGILDFYGRTFETGEAGRFDVNYQHDGFGNYYHLAAQRNGPLLVVSFTDTATQERGVIEQALRDSQTREQVARAAAEAQRGDLLRAFEQAPMAVAVFRGPTYVIELANAAVCALWGRTAEQALGTPLFELLPEAAGQGFEELLDEVMATGVPHVAHELPSKIERGGSVETVYWSFIYKALRGADGQISSLVVVATDASEQVQARQRILTLNKELADANERLRVSIAELEQKVADRTNALVTTLGQLDKRRQEVTQALAAEQQLGELKSRFVAMASHEFRSPLTVVLSSADLIERYPATDQQPQRLKHLNHIRAAAQQLVDILEEFLSVGRIEEGNMQSHPGDIDVPALLGEIVADVQVLLKPGQAIDWHLQGAVPACLDGSLLRKILLNVLSNAIKYSGEGSVVTLRGTCDGQKLTLRVQDQGVGISAEDQAHLFERFFRARNVSTVPGTGLGLYIIGKYLELMGGTIALQSELSVGTTVTLTIPYEKHLAD